jgi:5'-3' exonuclease
MSVLLVDGDNLLTIGFFGAKNYFYKGTHIGGIYHFLDTLRRSFEKYNLEKIVVFWDGDESSILRRNIYSDYKLNRKNRIRTEEEISSYNYQRIRIKQYLEEVYVRQGEFKYCESDDCIAYYVQNSENEHKIIYSSDGDLTQLISEKTSIYNPSHKNLYAPNDIIKYQKHDVLIENVKTLKILCGDDSDNILGIKGIGIKKVVKLFPEIANQKVSIEDILSKSKDLLELNKKNKTLQNIVNGVTKTGSKGSEFYVINEKIVNLSEPMLTDEARESIISLIRDHLDPDGRSYKNTMKMMVEDGIFNLLPKSDDAWIKFLNPFLRLTRKEKNKRLISVNK